MSIRNRYFLYRNRFNPDMITGNVEWLGGTGSGDIYLKIPLLLLGKYGTSISTQQIFSGVCYYFDYMKKPCIKLILAYQASLNYYGPCQTYCYFNINNRPVFTDNLYETCYCGQGRQSKAENDLKDCWIVHANNSQVPPLSDFNSSYAAESDWGGYLVHNYDWQSQKTVGYQIQSDHPQLGDVYTVAHVRVAYDVKENVSASVPFFRFTDKDYIYYRSEDAVDLTPPDLKQTDFDLAGKWTAANNSADLNKLYIGMPVFEYRGGTESIKMIPVNKDTDYINSSTPSDIDERYRNTDNYYVYDLMTGYDNSLSYSYIQHYTSTWNGSGWDSATEHFKALGWTEREQNGGYWREDLTTSDFDAVDEDNPPGNLTWVSLDGKTSKADLSCTYLGSTIEPNIMYRYEKRFPSRFLHLTMHNFNQNYHYDTEVQ